MTLPIAGRQTFSSHLGHFEGFGISRGDIPYMERLKVMICLDMGCGEEEDRWEEYWCCYLALDCS